MKERIVRHTREELKKMRGKTDHAYVRNTSDAEIRKQVQNDPDSYLPSDEELKKFHPVHKDNDHD